MAEEKQEEKIKLIFKDGPFEVSINFERPDIIVSIDGTTQWEFEGWIEYYSWYLKGKAAKD